MAYNAGSPRRKLSQRVAAGMSFPLSDYFPFGEMLDYEYSIGSDIFGFWLCQLCLF